MHTALRAGDVESVSDAHFYTGLRGADIEPHSLVGLIASPDLYNADSADLYATQKRGGRNVSRE